MVRSTIGELEITNMDVVRTLFIHLPKGERIYLFASKLSNSKEIPVSHVKFDTNKLNFQ